MRNDGDAWRKEATNRPFGAGWLGGSFPTKSARIDYAKTAAASLPTIVPSLLSASDSLSLQLISNATSYSHVESTSFRRTDTRNRRKLVISFLNGGRRLSANVYINVEGVLSNDHYFTSNDLFNQTSLTFPHIHHEVRPRCPLRRPRRRRTHRHTRRPR
jgi:hypothetical protein